MKKLILIVIIMLLPVTLLLRAQGGEEVDCTPEALQQQYDVFSTLLTVDFEDDSAQALANMYRLAEQYQRLAIACGYQPDEQQINAIIELTLSVTDINTILAAQSVGDDVDAALAEIESTFGDSFTGQLLYTGTEPGLDGSGLGCSGCHDGEAAPPTEGMWTRIHDIRLAELAEAGQDEYTVERYMVESILHPNAYVAEGYAENLMPPNYGSRLDAQMLADLVAYLSSQDQLLDDE